MGPVYVMKLIFRAEQPFSPPAFQGSMWRGAFGHALKRLVCVMQLRACEGCALEYACIYPRLFETRPRPDADVMRLYKRAPHPFILRVPAIAARREALETLALEIRLMGKAVQDTPYVVLALRRAGEAGLGRERIPVRLTEIRDARDMPLGEHSGALRELDPLPFEPGPPPRLARLTFRSPVRLVQGGHLAGPDDLDASALAMSAVRRAGLLSHFFADEPIAADFAALKHSAAKVVFASRNLRWLELRRYSARQKTRLGMGGLMGEVVIDLSVTPELWPFIVFAGQCGLGKGATMGLGDIVVEPME